MSFLQFIRAQRVPEHVMNAEIIREWRALSPTEKHECQRMVDADKVRYERDYRRATAASFAGMFDAYLIV